MSMHDGLGQAGRAAGVDNPQGMVERQPQRLEGPCCRIVARNRLGEGHMDQCRVGPAQRAQMVEHQQMTHRRQRRAQLRHHRQPVLVPTTVGHAVTGDQHRGFDLAEAVEHGVAPHVGRTDAPDAADADGGQKGDHGLGNVRKIGHDPVSRLHALGLQVQGQGGHLPAQFRPGHLARRTVAQAALVVADDGRHGGRMGRVRMAQHLTGVIELRPDKPARAGHLALGQDGIVRCR